MAGCVGTASAAAVVDHLAIKNASPSTIDLPVASTTTISSRDKVMAISNAIIRPFGCAFQRTAKRVLRIAFRKKLYASIEALQADLDEWIRSYNEHAVAAMTSGQPIRQNGRMGGR